MAQPMNHSLRRLAAYLAVLAPAAVAGAGASPPQGLYQVDQEFTMQAAAAPANAVQLVKKTDGATGDYTLTRRATVDGAATAEHHPGKGPVRACVGPGLPPAWLDAQRCEGRKTLSAPNGHEFAADCMKGRSDEQWQRLDDRTWQHRYAVPVSQTATARVPPATAAALAPAIAALEERARNGPPEHAEMARKQLAAMRGEGSSGGTVAATVVERWTRIADTCPGAP